MRHSPIHCTLHDYIEILCLYRLEVRVLGITGEYQGQGLNTYTDSNKQEWLCFRCNQQQTDIALDEIIEVEPLKQTPLMRLVRFIDNGANQ